jgi:branched-chain amino acid transport system substrate-binding protein
VVRDDKTSPKEAKLAFEDLVINEGVVTIVGEFLDEVMISLMDLIAQFRMPFLDTGSSMTGTNELVAQEYEKYKYYFRVMFNSKTLTLDLERVARDVLRDKLCVKKIGLLFEEGIWGRDMAEFLGEQLPPLGFEVTTVFFPLEHRDFGPLLTQLTEAGVEAILVAFAYNDGISFVNLWNLTQAPFHVFGINVSGQAYEYWDDTRGRVAHHVYADAATEATEITPKTLPFYEKYTQKYRLRPVRPLYTAYSTYDAMYILKEAFERAGTVDDPDLLVAELEKTDYIGTIGRVVFTTLEDPYPHDARYGDEYVVPKWVQWLKEEVGRKGRREVIYPPQYKSSEYVPPPWVLPKEC